MRYVIKRTDQGGGYVAKPGLKESYTKNIEKVRVFAFLEEAQRNLCIENEIVVPVNMRFEKLQYKQPGSELPCFRCHGMAATHRVTMNIGEHGGKLLVCLCESCLQIPETELYAHFALGGRTKI